MIKRFPIVYYKTVIPGFAGSFKTEWDNCIQTLQTCKEDADDLIMKLVVFGLSSDSDDYKAKKRYIDSTLKLIFPDVLPAFILVCQKPETPFQVSLEAALVKPGDCSLRSGRFQDTPYVVLEKGDYKELWASGIEGDAERQAYETGSEDAFRQALDLLASEGMGYNDIVRQWNYIGHILEESCIENTVLQNYQIYNEVRHQYYQQHMTAKGFPAATGIGNDFDGVLVDICAIRGTEGVSSHSVSNPKQVNPFVYGQEVLEGQPIHNQPRKHPPEFERAKLVVTGDISRVFISGTAAIIGQKTIGQGDIVVQTNCTIDNMNELYTEENLLRCSNLPVKGIPVMQYVRVYIKYEHDLAAVKQICEQKYPGVPTVYVFTDVCRNDLLVEMEGEVRF